jgi:hypothetical protein
MTFVVEKDEATAGRRFVPFRLFNSDGTSPDTTASNGTMLASLNGAAQLSLGSISAVSVNAGLYGMQLTASHVSTLGSLALYTDTVATPFPQHVATVQVVNYNPMSIQSGVLLGAGLYSTVTVRIDPTQSFSGVTVGVNNIAPNVYSGVSVGIKDSGIATTTFIAGNYSGVSVEIKTGGIQTNSVGSATYSGVTVGANPVGDKTGYGVTSIAAGTYSGVSVEVKAGGIQTTSIGKGAYSGVSLEVTTGGIQVVSIGKGAYSGVSFEVTTGGLQTTSIGQGTYSGVTFGINNIAPNAYSGVTVDGAKFLSPAGERSIASSYLSTNLGGTTPHLVQQAYELLRNKVQISGSTMTVFQTDGATSSWTATISTGTATVYGVTPNT